MLYFFSLYTHTSGYFSYDLPFFHQSQALFFKNIKNLIIVINGHSLPLL